MFRVFEAPAAEFRQELRAVFLSNPQGLEIDMQAFHVALPLFEPAGGAVDKPRGVQRLQAAVCVIRAELAPAFVEDRPQADAGMVSQQAHGFVHRFQEMLPGFRVPVQPGILLRSKSHSRQDRIPQETVFPAVDHILENHHAQAVAVVVELLRLNLDMLPQHVEAQALHGPDVRLITFRLCGRVQPVAPVPLVQQAVKEVRLSVEAQPRFSLHHADRQRPQGKVGLHPVRFRLHGEPVQARVFRTPVFGVLHPDVRLSPGQGIPHGFQFHRTRIRTLRGDLRGIPVRTDREGTDIPQRHRLQPHRLPDAGHRRVPHAAAFFLLLAPGMPVGKIVDGGDGELVFSLVHQLRDVRGERQVAFPVDRRAVPVYADHRHAAHRAEVQQDSHSLPAFRQDKAPGVRHLPAVFHFHFHAGKQAFRAEWHPDFRLRAPVFKIPFPVQAQPFLPHHLRPRIGVPRGAGKRFPGCRIQFPHRESSP